MWKRRERGAGEVLARPSYLFNNFSAGDRHMAYASSKEVLAVPVRGGEAHKIPLPRRKVLMGLRHVRVGGFPEPLVALSGDFGLQIWEEDGSRMVAGIGLDGLLPGASGPADEVTGFAKGIGALPDTNQVAVGLSNGETKLLALSSMGSLSVCRTLQQHASVVGCVDCDGPSLATGAEDGEVAVWRVGEGHAPAGLFANDGDMVTCLRTCASEASCIAGFYTGRIRIYRLDAMELSVVVNAHSRALTGLAVAESGREFASVSEDQVLSVWSAPDYGAGDAQAESVELIFADRAVNNLVVGVAFVGGSGDRIAAVAYEKKALLQWDLHRG